MLIAVKYKLQKNKEFELRNRPNQSGHFEERKQWGLVMNLVYY